MKTLTKEEINEIREGVDIVDVVSDYISLTKTGKNYFGVCPFHQDTNPSLSVSKEKQIFTCFSCHAAGNVFTFVADYENISFIESVKIVALKAGINVDIKSTNYKSNHIHEVYDISQKFYSNNINTQIGEHALEYLSKRQISANIIKDFGIGLALKSTDKLSNLLVKKEFNEKDLLSSGLIIKNEKGYHDFFYNRILFPLYDTNNSVVGYSGRIFDNADGPKYINSKEHPLFKKGEFLYNYYKAKEYCRSNNAVILMEGFMDVIRAYTIGVKNVVATMGTAFTKEHANLIKRLSKNVIICYDGDQAGGKATLMCCDELVKIGVIPKIIRLEENLDPDEYILKYGKDKFTNKIQNPITIMDFKLSFYKNNKDISQSEDQADYVNHMLGELNKIDDDVLKEITLKKLSSETNLEYNFLKSKINNQVIDAIPKMKKVKTTKYESAQLSLLFYMFRHPKVIKMYNNQIFYFPNKEYRLLAKEVCYFQKNYGYINMSELIDSFDESLIKVFGQVESLNLPDDYVEEVIMDYINAIKEINIFEECELLEKKQKEETDEDKKAIIGQRILELLIRREEDV